MTPEPLRLVAQAAGNTTVARFAGSKVALHDHTVALLRHQLAALADAPGPGTLYVDFGNVESLSSRVFDVLIALRRRLEEAGRRLIVGNVAPAVYAELELLKVTAFLDVRPGAGAGAPAAAGPAAAGVLVVDDEAAVRDVLGAWLRRHGFTIWLAATGQEALALYRQHRPAIGLVLLDVRMPGLSGPATLAALRRLKREVRCCFMSGDPGPQTEESLLGLGAARVFQKPFDLGEVARAVRRLLDCPGPPG
jgi:CheY-like chemotaxis protein/anti-anti-sigma regulatory factor